MSAVWGESNPPCTQKTLRSALTAKTYQYTSQFMDMIKSKTYGIRKQHAVFILLIILILMYIYVVGDCSRQFQNAYHLMSKGNGE